MRKSLRLILLFFAVLAVILCLFLIKGGGRAVADGEEEPEYVSLNQEVDMDLERIRRDWAQADGWLPELYAGHVNMIDQKEAAGLYDQASLRILSDTLNDAACSCLYRTALAEFHSPDCREEVIEKCMEGFSAICAKDSMYMTRSEVLQIKEIESLYEEIKAFCVHPFSSTPRVDVAAETWRPTFNENFNRGRARRDAYLADSIYVEHIKSTSLRRSLNSIEKMRDSERKIYYDKVMRTIILHFESITPAASRYTEANLKKIRSLNSKIIQTVSTDTRILRDYRDEFASKVSAYSN